MSLTKKRRTVTTAPAPSDSARAAMRSFVTGVSVLTCGTAEEVEGVTVSTLSVIPGEPPMVCAALRGGSRGLYALLHAQTFVANGLAADQEPLARHFAQRRRPRGLGQLPPESWTARAPEEVPRLSGAVAWLECRPETAVPAGDHELIVARVLSAVHTSGAPLVNFAGVLHCGPLIASDMERNP
ncbi:flavin reductase family protein [Streptomyces daliensis]|uniref:Flavin reductase n=1 Tax=Streptomyces daliensis TaxID=299421 RepID=A0A8T4IYC3_9ACTN|nr:flavin reductase [Streptomyces daliensis]